MYRLHAFISSPNDCTYNIEFLISRRYTIGKYPRLTKSARFMFIMRCNISFDTGVKDTQISLCMSEY